MTPAPHFDGKLSVRRMGFGAMQLPGPGVWGPPRDRDAALAVLRRAVELGVDHIDTAQYYGPDVANALIREALHPYSDELRIVTKVGAVRGPDRSWIVAAQPDELRAAVEDNLRSLGVERIAAVNLRLPGSDGGMAGAQDVALEDSLGALVELRDAGSIELLGLSNCTLEELRRAQALTPIACVQNRYNALARESDELLTACAAEGIAFVPFFPLGSAFGVDDVRGEAIVVEIAQRHGATPAQVALAWLLAHAGNVLLIPGTSSVAHLEENIAAGELELSEDDVAAIDALGG